MLGNGFFIFRKMAQKYDFDRDYFSLIDSPVKAYIVGFMAADAGVAKKAISIKVSTRDVSVLELIKKEVGSDVPIKFRTGCPIGDGRYTQSDFCYIRLCSKKMFEDLILLGVTPVKSLTLLPPTNIPCGLMKYWILGYFDGDGTVHHLHKQSPRFSFLGTFEVLSFIQNHLVENAGLTRNKIVRKKDANFWVLAWGGAINVIKFREYMYDENSWFPFQRKKDRFLYVSRKERVYKKGIPVLQYDLSGNLINEWPNGVKSIIEAGFKCGRNIYDALLKDGATAYGFRWAYNKG